MENQLFNPRIVAKRLDISLRALDSRRKKGLIRCHNLGYNTIRYSEDQIQEYLASPLTVKTTPATGGITHG